MSVDATMIRELRVRIIALERAMRTLGGGALANHAGSHQNGGSDELSVSGLSGVLADPQTVAIDPAGALDGDGSVGDPLAVIVDGVTITINGSNELEAIDGGGGGNRQIQFTIDGGGAAIATGARKAYVRVPINCTIVRSVTLADQSGSIVLDIWKDSYANFPPTVADTITASAKPTLSSAIKAEDTTLTGWTTSLSAGDVLEINVDSCSGITKVQQFLEVSL